MPLTALRSSSVQLFSGLSFLPGSPFHKGVTCCVLALWYAALQLCKGTYSVGFGALNRQGRKGIVEVQTLSSQGHSLFHFISMFSDCWGFRCSSCLMLSSFSVAGDEGMRDTPKRNFDPIGYGGFVSTFNVSYMLKSTGVCAGKRRRKRVWTFYHLLVR